MDLSPVPRVAIISQDDFLARFKRPCKPVVIERLTENWPARGKWTLDYLKRVAGETQVPLYDGQPSRGRAYQYAATARMTLGAYLERIAAGENDLRIFSLNILAALPQLANDFSFPDIGL